MLDSSWFITLFFPKESNFIFPYFRIWNSAIFIGSDSRHHWLWLTKHSANPEFFLNSQTILLLFFYILFLIFRHPLSLLVTEPKFMSLATMACLPTIESTSWRTLLCQEPRESKDLLFRERREEEEEDASPFFQEERRKKERKRKEERENFSLPSSSLNP